MEGIILDFNQTEGAIRCHAGQRYTFALTEWQSAEVPERGALVDFIAEGQHAKQVYLLARASPESAPSAEEAVSMSAAPTPAQPSQRVDTSVLAIISLIAGILGIFLFGSLIAVVCGHLARAEIRRKPGQLEGDGLAVAGLVLGYIGLAFTLLIVILFGLVIGGGILAAMSG
jgi:hypothetical protein